MVLDVELYSTLGKTANVLQCFSLTYCRSIDGMFPQTLEVDPRIVLYSCTKFLFLLLRMCSDIFLLALMKFHAFATRACIKMLCFNTIQVAFDSLVDFLEPKYCFDMLLTGLNTLQRSKSYSAQSIFQQVFLLQEHHLGDTEALWADVVTLVRKPLGF